MSSYATLSLSSMELAATRDDIDPGLIWMFRPSDRHIERIDRRDRRRLARYVTDEYVDEYDESNPFTIMEYRCTAAAARDRLDLQGFTCEVAEAYFEKELESAARDNEESKKDQRLTRIAHIFEERHRVIRKLTFSSWLDGFIRIKEERLTRTSIDELPDTDVQLPLLRYMIEGFKDSYGFPGWDYRHFIRTALETAPPEEVLTYDLSDLVAGGWVDETDELIAIAENLIDEDFVVSKRVIVLTEGDVDRQVLERSLRLLYPHLADYFHFFDFTGRKLGGGAGELVKLVRAFAAADVRHRILALFDNDTAARAALKSLDVDSLPTNIVVRQYPSLSLARKYPTIGPSGEAHLDVNGLAGSLELYLGNDVLKSDKGGFFPVQWKGYDQGTSAYQGVILDKQKALDRFWGKLAHCETHPDQIANYDWEGIKAIIDTMRRAFHRSDTQAILSGAIYE